MEGIFGEELAKPSQMKHCWVAPPHLHKGGTVFMFSLLGHVITDRARVTHGTFFFFMGGGGAVSKTILNACSVIYKELTP